MLIKRQPGYSPRTTKQTNIRDDTLGHHTEIKGRSKELGGREVIEIKYNLKHSNNLRLKKWSIYRGGHVTEGVSLRGFDYILIIIFII